MPFNSPRFLLFLAATVAVHYALPRRFRVPFLAVAGYVFYMAWTPAYALLLAASTAAAYGFGLAIDRAADPRPRKRLLAIAIAFQAGLLAVFKYAGFVNESLRTTARAAGLPYDVPVVAILLPVGLSFYVFKSISYVADVYRRRLPADASVARVALYVGFFSQLVAGPIERATRLLPQMREPRRVDYAQVKEALLLILWGFFKKIVIADRLAAAINPVWSAPERYDPWTLLVAAYSFSFQIYCDFSGYSDVAIGAALLLGYRIRINFDKPYFADSLRDFWRRWHISLMDWFRDYLYIPLGGNRAGRGRTYANLMLVFLISGLWHGAAWTFVVWGAVHGAMLVVARATGSARERAAAWLRMDRVPALRRALRVVVTFHLVTFAWVFFRAESLGDAFLVLHRIAAAAWNAAAAPAAFAASIARVGIAPRLVHAPDLALAFVMIAGMEVVHLLERGRAFPEWVEQRSGWTRVALWCVLLWAILIFGRYGADSQEFIYARF
jgi:D-alanyl-lipoteichoic acid acyltransferase DltB (MBOAT superfamily)